MEKALGRNLIIYTCGLPDGMRVEQPESPWGLPASVLELRQQTGWISTDESAVCMLLEKKHYEPLRPV
jgi:hypothetical protein